MAESRVYPYSDLMSASTDLQMFTEADIKALYRLSVSDPALPSPPPCLELVSGSGVVFEQSARDAVEKRITQGVTRTSIFNIATDLELDPRAVERLLPASLGQWGRVGPSGIVCRPEFERLKIELEAEIQKGVVIVMKFCRRTQIDTDLFRRLLPPKDGSWAWFGHDLSAVYSISFYDDQRRRIEAFLKATERPVPLSSLLPEPSLPSGFASKLVLDAIKAGAIDGSIEVPYFVPKAYVTRRRMALVEELRNEGVISCERFQELRVKDDAEAFVKKEVPDAVLLAHHFVTPGFIAYVEGIILDQIESQEWSDVKDPQYRLTIEDERKLRDIICKNMPELQLVSERLVHKDLAAELAEKSRTYAHLKAETGWKKDKTVRTTITRPELSKHLGAAKTLPPLVLSHFTNQLYPLCQSLQLQRLNELRESEILLAKNTFVDRFCLRLIVHYRGIEHLEDKTLKSKLSVDLLQYAQESGISSVGKLESALLNDPQANLQELFSLQTLLKKGVDPKASESMLADVEISLQGLLRSLGIEYPGDDAVEKRKQILVDEMKSKLQIATDLPTQLLLAILLIHAAHKPGVIRATGKYVPKLLKELQATGVLTQDQSELLNRAKAAAMNKGHISEDEVETLRILGGSSTQGGTHTAPTTEKD